MSLVSQGTWSCAYVVLRRYSPEKWPYQKKYRLVMMGGWKNNLVYCWYWGEVTQTRPPVPSQHPRRKLVDWVYPGFCETEIFDFISATVYFEERNMIFTTLGPDHPLKVVAEVGSGGGRVAAQVAGLVPRLVCFDISDVMLKRAQKTLKERQHWTHICIYLLPKWPLMLVTALKP